MKISYKQVEEYCNDLHRTAKDMKEVLDNVNDIGRKTINKEAWSGTAADYYAKKLSKLTSNFEEIFCELENSVLFMANCSDGYQAIDKTIVKEICDNLKITNPNLVTSKIFNGG